jgi:hypothetical protein
LEVITVDEIYSLYRRDPHLVDRNKSWLKNRLTPLRYYKFVKPIYSQGGPLIKVELTRKGREAIESLDKEPVDQHDFNTFGQHTTAAPAHLSATTEHFTYPFPLLNGDIVHLSLPIRLSTDDARRIATFIEDIALTPSTHTREAKL